MNWWRYTDANAAVGLERQPVFVPRDVDVGLRRQRRGQDEVVIGIAADPSGQRQRRHEPGAALVNEEKRRAFGRQTELALKFLRQLRHQSGQK